MIKVCTEIEVLEKDGKSILGELTKMRVLTHWRSGNYAILELEGLPSLTIDIEDLKKALDNATTGSIGAALRQPLL